LRDLLTLCGAIVRCRTGACASGDGNHDLCRFYRSGIRVIYRLPQADPPCEEPDPRLRGARIRVLYALLDDTLPELERDAYPVLSEVTGFSVQPEDVFTLAGRANGYIQAAGYIVFHRLWTRLFVIVNRRNPDGYRAHYARLREHFPDNEVCRPGTD
jgi:hypothetical protein